MLASTCASSMSAVAAVWTFKQWKSGKVEKRNSEKGKHMSSVIGLEQVCKVRNAAVGRADNGYSLAVFKKANKRTAPASPSSTRRSCRPRVC
jgi:hypothetical protein